MTLPASMRYIAVREPGPPSVMTIAEGAVPAARPGEVVIEVDTPQSAVLVLNDMWHPWWSATLDGQPVEILRANVLFRAVAVPPGKHTVRFTFNPVSGALAQLWDKVSARWR